MIARPILLLVAMIATATPSLTAQTPHVRTTIAELLSLRIDPARVATISDATLQRDVGVIQMASGRLYFARPVAGRTLAAVFIGTGTFRYRPPIDVERAHLKRFYEVEEIVEPITSAVILFTDRTEADLASRMTAASAGNLDEAQSLLVETLETIGDASSGDVEPSFVRAIVNGGREGLFFAKMEGEKLGRIYLEIDPFNAEEVGFMRQARARLRDIGRDDINRHHLQDEYLSGTDGSDDVFDFTFDRYRINASIARDLTFTGSYEIPLTMLRDSVRWSYFYLQPDLDIDSLTWSDGRAVEMYRADESPIVWFAIAPGLKRGEKGTLRLVAHGDPLGRVENTVYLKSSSMWYPRHDFKNTALFDLTYRTPEQFLFASAGRPTAAPVAAADNTIRSHWVLDEPSRNVSFNIGYFYETRVEPDSMPPIVVLRDKDAAKGDAEQIAWDIENSMRFFQHLFGPARPRHFSATQIPFDHGEAFPGLIHLSWLTFESDRLKDVERTSEVKRDGFNEFFRAHEVAHQWWGIGVDYASYHDQWISEGFAEYSGLMYVQAVLKDNATFFDWLRYFRQKILENRNSIFATGQEAGPIWLGHRTNTSTTQGDYGLIVYKKGAWVLHMLRLLMLDPNTLSDEKFRVMMREFYTTYVGRLASTADFKRVVEKHTGTRMDWFFDQWVYGTAIPTYRFAWTGSPTDDGKYRLKCRIDQSDVPADFRSYPMLTIDFGSNRLSRGRRPVQGARTEFEIILPEEPERVIFNDLESVLCTVEEVDW